MYLFFWYFLAFLRLMWLSSLIQPGNHLRSHALVEMIDHTQVGHRHNPCQVQPELSSSITSQIFLEALSKLLLSRSLASFKACN